MKKVDFLCADYFRFICNGLIFMWYNDLDSRTSVENLLQIHVLIIIIYL